MCKAPQTLVDRMLYSRRIASVKQKMQIVRNIFKRPCEVLYNHLEVCKILRKAIALALHCRERGRCQRCTIKPTRTLLRLHVKLLYS
jgi:hypothetical protein